MKLNQSSNLRVEDFPDQASWIGRLFTILNSFITSVGQIFDQNIDYATNIKSVTRDFDFSSLTLPVVFEWPFQQAQPIDLRVCKALKNSTPIALLASWTYDASAQEISVTSISEVSDSGTVSLTSIGPRYKFTIRATI